MNNSQYPVEEGLLLMLNMLGKICNRQHLEIQLTLIFLKVKIWSLPKDENLTTGNKILWKRGEIAPNLFSTIFSIHLEF